MKKIDCGVSGHRARTLLKCLLMTKLTVWLILVCSMQSFAHGYGQNNISLNLEKVQLKKALKAIEDLGYFRFVYKDELLPKDQKVTLHVRQASLDEVLSKLLDSTALGYRRLSNNLVVIAQKDVYNAGIPAAVTITGKVMNTQGEPLAGASVLEKGTHNGTSTDSSGNFTLSVLNANETLVISSVGYAQQEFPLNGKTSITAVLQAADSKLDEIVVIGYQAIRKKDLTGAVSVVDANDIKKLTATTVGEALQGMAAGVSVRSGGKPGQESIIEIRGVGNFANNTPLFVIDGLISNGNRDFNPNDIESIQVLKDASAAAIYGANAANGVVIITTKKGKEGPLRVNLSAKYGIQQVPKRWDLTNNVEFAELNKQAYANAGKPPMASVSTEFNPAINTDWQKAILRTGSTQEYNVEFSGGGKTSNYLVSGNYFKNDGTVLGTSFDRISLRINSEGRRGIFKIGENLSLNNSHEDLMQGNPFIDMVRMLPVIPVYDANNPGGYGYGSDKAYTFGTNPVALNNLVQEDQYNFRVRGNAYAELAPVKWIVYKMNYGLETSFDHFTSLRKAGSWTYNQPVDPSNFYENRAQYLSQLFENTVNFDKKLGKHNINGVVGTSYRVVTYEQTNGKKLNITQLSNGPYYPQLDAGLTNPQTGGYKNKFVTFSYLGRLNYDYDGRYLLSATFRRDGDSRFGTNYRYGNFPSISAAWRLSKEAFFHVPWISDLKLRGSYGELGTSNIGEFDRFGKINLFPIAVFGTGQTIQNGAIQTQLVNPDVHWETKKTTNIGLDAGLFNNQFSFSVEYYKAKTVDVLTHVPVPQTSGNRGDDPFINAASLQNTGFEFSGTYRNSRHRVKFDISANVSTVHNKVLALGDLGQGITYIATGLTRTQIGHPIGSWFLLQSDGIFQNQKEIDDHKVQPFAKPGDIRYVDVNKDGVLDNNDRTFIGSPWPKFQSGLLFNAYYGSFSLSIQLYGSFGNKIFNATRSVIDRFDDNSNYRKGIQPWTEQNHSTSFPRIAYSGDIDVQFNTRGDTDRWLEDGSYVKMRNIQLGYALPDKLLKRISFQSVRLFLSGQNLFTITKYTGLDPDIVGNGLLERGNDNGNYPSNRIFSLGVQCGF